MRSLAASSAVPAQASPTVIAVSRTTPAALMSNAATPSRSSDHTGIPRCTGDARAPGRAGSESGTRTAITATMTTSTPKAQRHELYWANSPPAAGPTSVPTPHMADTSAEAFVHSTTGSAVLITA